MASKIIVYAFLICILQFLEFSAAQDAVKAGYWFWDGGLDASDIDSTLFTHLFCAYSDLDNKTYQLTISASKAAPFSQFTQTVQLKNPSVKTLLSIGGYSANNSDYASMASTPTNRKSFIDSSLKLARSDNFLGLDLSWIDPQSANDLVNLGTLLDEWRVAADAEAKASGKPRLLLTAAVSVEPNVDYGVNFPVQSISRNLDWINVMTYDFYGPAWDWTPNMTNAPAALYDPSGEVSGSRGIRAWIRAGVNAKKLVLSMPFYGYAWKLVDPNNHGLLAPANGPGPSENRDDGSMNYNQILEFIANNKATTVYNATIVANYCYTGTTWIGFDDKQSISAKVLYAKQNGLLGYSVSHVAADANWALSRQAGLAFKHDKQKRWMLIVWPTLAVIALLLGSMMLLRRRRRVIRSKVNQILDRGKNSMSPNLQVFSFAAIKDATNNFSMNNKLGEGGYGPVYKGKLPNGQEIAAKRLSQNSKQGLEEFENEVTLTAKLQHVNLVRLLGFCTAREEKMLIYEYMPNKSLDFYLYESIGRSMLQWEKWVHIIEGVIQGLLYLQEYSRLTIIHRDLKASNILLDAEMRPKISDFGIARSFQKNENEGNTENIVGTYGYVPPEYVKQGIYSRKYDVYSFGVILLQIISGKKCTHLYGPARNLNLLEYAYELLNAGKGTEFMDPSLDDATSSCKLIRCMQVALLCVQENWAQRPTMLEISSMLKNEIEVIPNPEKPAFSINDNGEAKKFTAEDVISVDIATISQLVPR